MHSSVLIKDDRVHGTGKGSQSPVHNAVTPVRGTGICDTLCTSRAADLAQSSSDELLRVGDGGACTLDLRHGRGNEIGLHKLDVNTVRLQLGSQSATPLLEESFAARVRGQERSRKDATKRSHGEDETATALNHTRCNDLGDTKRAHAVDGDDILQLLLGSLDERNRHLVAQANIVDKNRHFQIGNQRLQGSEIRIEVLGKVHGENLGLNRAVLGLDLGSKFFELGLGTRNQHDVEAFGSQLQGVFLTNAIRSTSNDCPATLATELR